MSAQKSNRKLVIGLFGLCAFMVGASFAAVPLYNMFCRVTGYAGTTNRANQGSDKVLDQVVTIRFTGNTDREMPWKFKPEQTQMKLHIGETGLAFFEATNPTDRVVAGTASYNVTPFSAGGYFTKIQCFCFTEQVLKPGESVRMPVTFYIDPEILEDDEAKFAHTITLSYTFHETELPDSYSESAEAPIRVDEPDPAG